MEVVIEDKDDEKIEGKEEDVVEVEELSIKEDNVFESNKKFLEEFL